MKPFAIGLLMLLFSVIPAHAQSIFDDDYEATRSATPSATPRAVTYLDTSNTPTSGAVENTIALLIGGFALIFVGLRLSYPSPT